MTASWPVVDVGFDVAVVDGLVLGGSGVRQQDRSTEKERGKRGQDREESEHAHRYPRCGTSNRCLMPTHLWKCLQAFGLARKVEIPAPDVHMAFCGKGAAPARISYCTQIMRSSGRPEMCQLTRAKVLG